MFDGWRRGDDEVLSMVQKSADSERMNANAWGLRAKMRAKNDGGYVDNSGKQMI